MGKDIKIALEAGATHRHGVMYYKMVHGVLYVLNIGGNTYRWKKSVNIPNIWGKIISERNLIQTKPVSKDVVLKVGNLSINIKEDELPAVIMLLQEAGYGKEIQDT